MTRVENVKRNITTYLCVALFAGITLAVFAPIELYLSNKDFFFFEGNELFGVVGLGFLAIVIGVLMLLAIAEIVSENIAKVLLGAGFGLVLAIYIQGNFLPGDYGSLDGTAVDWSQYTVRGIVSVAMFIVVIGLLVLFSVKGKKDNLHKAVRVISICIILVQVMTLAALMIQKGGFAKDNKFLATTAEEFNYSSDENMVILMLDSFDGSVLDDVIKQDSSGEFSALIKDFTFYPDTSGMYKSTVFALPYLMNGVEYLNDSTYEEFLEKGYNESPILKRLAKDNWYTGIYNLNRMPASETAMKAENCKEVELSVSSHKKLGIYMFKLVGFRYMPQPFKKYFWFYGDDINTELMDTSEDVELYSDTNMAFADGMDAMTVNSARKTYHFYELLGAHPPYYFTSDFQLSDTETDTYETAKGMLTMINRFTDKLKECGVYDNTTIIVLADHGTDIRWNPVFMIKYANANHDLKVDQTPFSYAYLQELYIAILDGKSEDECSALIEKHNGQVRTFLLYDENDGMNDDDYFTANIYRCEITGTATNNDAIYIGSEVYECVE